jgi:hypothetical protein
MACQGRICFICLVAVIVGRPKRLSHPHPQPHLDHDHTSPVTIRVTVLVVVVVTLVVVIKVVIPPFRTASVVEIGGFLTTCSRRGARSRQ